LPPPPGSFGMAKKKGSEYSYQLPGGGLSARMRDSSSSSSGSNNNCSVTKTTTTVKGNVAFMQMPSQVAAASCGP